MARYGSHIDKGVRDEARRGIGAATRALTNRFQKQFLILLVGIIGQRLVKGTTGKLAVLSHRIGRPTGPVPHCADRHVAGGTTDSENRNRLNFSITAFEYWQNTSIKKLRASHCSVAEEKLILEISPSRR
jgi:hypothetical protein